ncbi:MAG: heavy metal sensor histidine kinase [Pseudomonadota bacterium]
MMHLLPNSITARTSVLFTGIAALVLAVMGLVIQVSVNRHFVEQDQTAITGKLELISNILQGAPTTDNTARIQRQLTSALVGHHDLVVRVQARSGQDIFMAGHDRLPDAAMMTATVTPALRSWSDGSTKYRLVVTDILMPDGQLGWRIGIAINTLHHAEFLAAFERELLLIGSGGLLCMALLGWVAIRRGLKPVQKMAMVTEGISAKRLHNRIATETIPVELESLAHAFNAMLDRLSDSLERLSAFSSDLAHELRTPVNNLMTQTQVLLSKPRENDDYREVLYSNLEEFERLARMISDMLFLAKADNGLIIPHREEVQLDHEVTAVFDFYEALAADKHLVLKVEGQASVAGDALMLRRVISNLLSNAVRHAHADSIIDVRISTQGDTASLVIENVGETIAEQHLPHLFERFYRADSARQRNEEGVGLGLAITRSILAAHQGDIRVSSGQGVTRFAINMPLA